MMVRMKPGDISNTLSKIESKWKTFVSGEPFDYNFLDASFDALYRSEQRMGSIFGIFTALLFSLPVLVYLG
jgi:putative ABC transport system permease protein